MSRRNHIPLSFSASPGFMKKVFELHSSMVREQKKIPEMLPRGLVQGKVNTERKQEATQEGDAKRQGEGKRGRRWNESMSSREELPCEIWV